MIGTEWTTLVVALAGVAGTIGASWLGQRALRWQAREQAVREQRALTEQRRERALREQQELYIALNSAARDYRLALTYAARSLALSGRITAQQMTGVEQARSVFGRQYARAEMMLPRRVLQVATEACRCLAIGYQLLTRAGLPGYQQHTAQPALDWARDTLNGATALLRMALREDLGADALISDLDNKIIKFAVLRAAHESEPDAVCSPSAAEAIGMEV